MLQRVPDFCYAFRLTCDLCVDTLPLFSASGPIEAREWAKRRGWNTTWLHDYCEKCSASSQDRRCGNEAGQVTTGFRFANDPEPAQAEQEAKRVDFEPSNLKFRIDQHQQDVMSIRQIISGIVDDLAKSASQKDFEILRENFITFQQQVNDRLKILIIDVSKSVEDLRIVVKDLQNRINNAKNGFNERGINE